MLGVLTSSSAGPALALVLIACMFMLVFLHVHKLHERSGILEGAITLMPDKADWSLDPVIDTMHQGKATSSAKPV